MALDRRNYKQCVETTVEIAKKVGSVEILNRIVDDLKDENEQYRKMVMETVQVRLSAVFLYLCLGSVDSQEIFQRKTGVETFA